MTEWVKCKYCFIEVRGTLCDKDTHSLCYHYNLMRLRADEDNKYEELGRQRTRSAYIEHVRRIRAGEIACDLCDVQLIIAVCPRCGNPQASIKPKDRSQENKHG